MAERRTQDHYVESSPRSFGIGSKIGYLRITNTAGRLQEWMLGKSRLRRKRPEVKRWHSICQQLW